MEDERCRRRGTNWRCKEKAVQGKSYCEKHHLYSISRVKLKKTKKISGGGVAKKCDSSSSAAAATVEPYRPVIDFRAAAAGEEGLRGGTGNDGFALGEPGFAAGLFDSFGTADRGVVGGNDKFGLGEPGFGAGFFDSLIAADHGCGNDKFALNESGFGAGFFDSFGAADQGVEIDRGGGNDKFAFSEPGSGAGFFDSFGAADQGVELGGNDKFALGERGGGGSNQSGWSGNDDFTPEGYPEGKEQELAVERNDVKYEESDYLGKNNVGESGCGLLWRE